MAHSQETIVQIFFGWHCYLSVKVLQVLQLEGLKKRGGERERERESRSSDRPHILLSSIPAGS